MCWHNWSMWQVTERGNILRRSDETLRGTYFIQERTCEKCGKTQMDQKRVLI